MNARAIYHLARADFLERVRRYSFLVVLALVVFLGYQVGIGNISLQLGKYRGEYNSAWVGAMMALDATFFLGWLGFYVIKGSIARDRETGVGQIIATTPVSRPLYLLGKWISNFAALTVMVAILALAGLAIQFWVGENAQVNLFAFVSPFLLIALPLMALIAAFAALFETIPFLRGGFGNIVYFFMFILSMPLILETINPRYVAFEPTGIGLLESAMSSDVRAVYPDYDGEFTLGSTNGKIVGTFEWNGVKWTSDIVFARLSFFVLSVFLTMIAALFFDRFDPSRSKPFKRKSSAPSPATVESVAVKQTLPAVRLTPLNASLNRFRFFSVLLAELKLLLKGQRWWFYLLAFGFVFACLVNTAEITRQYLLMIAWVWPILLWSSMGNREVRDNVQQMTYSSASPLWRQLPAQWLAGFIVALTMASGALIRFALAGDGVAILAALSGAFFIPSLALASGVWSGSSKLFEILYIGLWYIGPLNRVPAVDYVGAAGNGRPEFFIPLSLALILAAFIGRARQLRM